MRVLSNRTGRVVTGLLGRSLLGLAACGMSGVLLVLGGCGSGGSGGAPPVATVQTGSVSGQVTTLVNGVATPVAGATVTTSAGSTTSGGDGAFTVPAPVGERSVVHVEAGGYAEAFPVAYVASGQTTGLGVRLLATGVTSVISVSTGGTVTVPNSTAQITLPADGLVPRNGGAAAGTVNVAVTPINPASDPRLMPGDYTGVSAGGMTPIESFGALLVDIRDNSGTRYNLAAGKTATIRIPLGTLSTNPPATIPLWYFDETAGLWQQEGSATLQGTAPNRYYEGTVSHFSYWNADQSWTPIFVSGCVRDSNNQPVVNLMVQAVGRDYSGSDVDFTAADGTFSVAVRQGGQATLGGVEFSLQTYTLTTVTNAVNVGPSTINFTLSNCLVKAPGPLTMTTSVLPGGNAGATYNHTLVAAGGIPGYVWSLNPGSSPLPVGISLNPSGVISGTPTTVGTTTITVRVTDSSGGTATGQLSLTISPAGVVPISITSLSPLPAGTVGTVYSMTLAASGGTGALSWSVSSGALPIGVTLSLSTGQISGTPTTQGTSTFTIRVQDSGTPQQFDQKSFSLTTNAVSSGSGGGTLTVSNAPAIVGGTFVAETTAIGGSLPPGNPTVGFVSWGEAFSQNFTHTETVEVLFTLTTGEISSVRFTSANTNNTGGSWTCNGGSLVASPCSGATVNRANGTVSFTGTVLRDSITSAAPITLNGTLRFAPF